MTGKTEENLKRKEAVPQLSEEAAERILRNVFRACGMPPNRIPFKVLAEKYKGGKAER